MVFLYFQFLSCISGGTGHWSGRIVSKLKQQIEGKCIAHYMLLIVIITTGMTLATEGICGM